MKVLHFIGGGILLFIGLVMLLAMLPSTPLYSIFCQAMPGTSWHDVDAAGWIFLIFPAIPLLCGATLICQGLGK